MTRLIPREETRAWNEVSSPALMGGGGHDEQFLTIPRQWADEPMNPFAGTATANRWKELVTRYGGETLAAAIQAPGVLTPEQQGVLRRFLDGQSRVEIGHARGVSRQAIHKVIWAAVRTLRKYLQDGARPKVRRGAQSAPRVAHEGGEARALGRSAYASRSTTTGAAVVCGEALGLPA